MTNDASAAHRLPLLASMANDMEQYGSMRPSTAAAMWAAYAAHTAFTGWALTRRLVRLPIPPGSARVAGAVLVAAGSGVCVAGMGRFAGVEEVTGTRNQRLLSTGIYRYSRNPQYLGFVVALTGGGVARRSGAGLMSAVALATVYSTWVPVEEQHLTRLHGQPYIEYTRRTHRWWGRRG